MLDIDACGILFIKKRQSHAAESEFWGVQERFLHGFLSFVRMLTYCLEHGSSQAFFWDMGCHGCFANARCAQYRGGRGMEAIELQYESHDGVSDIRALLW
ncbi:MAG: hypothetical protein ACLT98_08915, partial [Eggerthellaceae bacterium]